MADIQAADDQHARTLRQPLRQVDQSAHGAHPKPLRTSRRSPVVVSVRT
jgi:hypothetical protein